VLLVAGNETTRNAISGGMLALSLFPEQKQLMLDNLDIDDFMDKAVDELIRYVSPVLGFIRTVTEDHTYRNTDLKEGDRVLMLYAAANRDDDVFDTPTSSTCSATPTRTWPSASARTSASAPTSPAWRSSWCSRSC
jgi:cytochrome P450